MFDDMHKGSGCLKCPVNEFECDAQYRGSRCAALRAKVGVDFDPKTNADQIRAMSDEELANKCVRYEGQCVIPTKWGGHKHIFFGPKGETCTDREEAVKMWLDWLQQPAKEDI